MQTKLAQAAAVATLLVNSASAITDHPDGLGGDAPCMEQMSVVKESASVGGDPHLTQGLLSADKSYVAVGSALKDLEPPTFGTNPYRALIIKTNPAKDSIPQGTDYLEGYRTLDGAGSGANNYSWVTKLGAEGVLSRALWVSEYSSNGSTTDFYIAVGVTAQSDGKKSQMAIWKINDSDGSVAW